MELTETEIAKGQLVASIKPYLMTFIAKKEGEVTRYYQKPTMHVPNRLTRGGWSVWRVK